MRKKTVKITEKEELKDERRILDSDKALDELLAGLGTSMQGLTDEQAKDMLEKHGANMITAETPISSLRRLFRAFMSPFTVVLIVLAIVSVFTDVIMASPGNRSFRTVIVIVAMVTMSGVLRFVQETRSSNSAEKLKEMVKTTATVERDGRKDISPSDIVPGDIIHFAAGDIIDADVRIVTCKDLFVSQSALTGESEPVEKYGGAAKEQTDDPLDRSNLAFMGSTVISGSAICLVLYTGNDTYFGTMAKSISVEKVVTGFDRGVNAVSWVLIRFMMCMVPVVFVINGLTKGNWLEAFLFALAVAVGLTPEMLPMIVTTNLAKGSVRMARKKSIVKSLNAIQNFGAMDILCTDKTGTLTQNKVVLAHHLDVYGNEEAEVFRYAFLNSYFQTGLKNLMDVAVLERAEKVEPDIFALKDEYVKTDEIPFDFERRRMSVVIEDKEGVSRLVTKGAVEEMLKISTRAEYKGELEDLTDEVRHDIMETAEKLNAQGMRVVAVAQKIDPPGKNAFCVDDESDMVLMGYIAFLDPPKETTAAAIQALHEYGVGVKVLTGDNDGVTKYICNQVGMQVENLLLGTDVDRMDDAELSQAAEKTSVFAKLNPQQKKRIVRILRGNGNHVVGYMGDGINDAPALREADVGISVDTAVDIAKDSADIILLEKDLMILREGVIEGRKTFGNIIKYIKMTASSNFGNMFSVVVASAFLPFLPMKPIQILLLNLLYDVSLISIPWDNMDKEFMVKPRKWDASSISKFMLWLGPSSSVFDIITYLFLFFIICPSVCGGNYGASGVNTVLFITLFNAGWFVESLCTQTLVIHMIRTPKIPFFQSHASRPVLIATTAVIAAGMVIPYTFFGSALGMTPIPGNYYPWLVLVIVCYMMLATLLKTLFRRRYGELL